MARLTHSLINGLSAEIELGMLPLMRLASSCLWEHTAQSAQYSVPPAVRTQGTMEHTTNDSSKGGSSTHTSVHGLCGWADSQASQGSQR